MVIGICNVELHLPGNGSLKGKRSILKPLLARLRREFNLAAAPSRSASCGLGDRSPVRRET
jgi:uncharacterized protein YlxP (DUF503 family)